MERPTVPRRLVAPMTATDPGANIGSRPYLCCAVCFYSFGGRPSRPVSVELIRTPEPQARRGTNRRADHRLQAVAQIFIQPPEFQLPMSCSTANPKHRDK